MASRRKATSRPARRPRTSATRGGAGLREQLAATARILRALASAPGNLQAVLDAVAEHAARVCGAKDSLINRLEGDRLRLVAHHGPIGTTIESGGTFPLTRDSAPPGGAGAADRPRSRPGGGGGRVPDERPVEPPSGFRAMLAVPLVGEERVLGVITIRRSEARPFTAAQIAALESFADQAAIAIGHARLFQEVAQALERERRPAPSSGSSPARRPRSSRSSTPSSTARVRLCASEIGLLWLYDGEAFRLVADRGAPRQFVEPRRDRIVTARTPARPEP